MISRVLSICTHGIEAFPVDVEVRTKDGTQRFVIVGLGGAAIRESRDRIGTALFSSGFHTPDSILVNLAPAEIKKDGAAFDLAVALGVIVAEGIFKRTLLEGVYFLGELSLDGGVKPVRGVTAMAIEAFRLKARLLVVPKENEKEARIVRGLKVAGVSSLLEVLSGLQHGFPESDFPDYEEPSATDGKSFDQVFGQESAKRAALVAAAGRHNMLMIGPPGCGKSMVAERIPTLLPKLDDHEKLEVCRIQSIVGHSVLSTLAGERPFRAPHHTISDVGLFGGGHNLRPGEVTLSHRGVLFLDEFPEYKRTVLEALRTPLETRKVTISRAIGSVTFLADFQLVAAMNPCPCGALGSSQASCRCSQAAISGYLGRLSQPILDRIDLHTELKAVPLSQLQEKITGTCQSVFVKQILDAQEFRISMGRYDPNSSANQELIRKTVEKSAMNLLVSSGTKLGISARGASRVLRVARTLADLEFSRDIKDCHIAEALQFRKLERLSRYAGGLTGRVSNGRPDLSF